MSDRPETNGFFRHHKGQVYFAHGIAKHSETLEWAEKNGYVRIDTNTRNHFLEMLRLNLKHGYKIIGCTTEGGEPKIHLSKELK